MNKEFLNRIMNQSDEEEGFSLIELVVAVGILAILSVVGVVAYQGLTDNSRKTTVDAAAAEVLKGALAKDADGNRSTDPLQTDDEWMNSAGKNNKVHVEVAKDSEGIKVTAWYGDEKEYLIEKRSSGSTSPVINPEEPKEETPLPPIVGTNVVDCGTSHPRICEYAQIGLDTTLLEFSHTSAIFQMKVDAGTLTPAEEIEYEEYYAKIGEKQKQMRNLEDGLIADEEISAELAKRFYDDSIVPEDLSDKEYEIRMKILSFVEDRPDWNNGVVVSEEELEGLFTEWANLTVEMTNLRLK